MVKRIQVILEDDLDGGPADRTVSFVLNGAGYELDLSSDNADRLEKAFAPFVGVARRVGSRSGSTAAGAVPTRRAGNGATRTDPAQLKAIRDWAKANGQPVTNRGRIPIHVVTAFEAAHGSA